MEAAAAAGASFAHFVLLRLPGAVAGLFEDWLDRWMPERKARVLQRLRSMRGGELNVSQFGVRMRGQGPIAEAIRKLFDVSRARAGLSARGPALSTSAFRRPGMVSQGRLFDA